MPPKQTKAMAKKERLTLRELADYDDILTDALVDHVYFWATIRKNKAKYNLTRGISEDEVCKILRVEVICNKDCQKAERLLLKLPGLRKFLDRLKTEREKEDFKRHMRKYINMWLPDCPFEVSTTNRYTIVTQEAATVAKREIKKGETIKYLCGNLVAMTPEEEKDLDLTRRDFSIVMSSRKKTPSLFLGPARFANHDCDANARLVTTGSDGMQVVAVRKIEKDEEITVTYGEDYFGIDNCECLCRSCELAGRNAWTLRDSSAAPSDAVTPKVEDTNDIGYSFRNKRKVAASGTSSASMTPDVEEGRTTKRRRSLASSLTSTATPTQPRSGRSSKKKSKSLGSGLREEITAQMVKVEEPDAAYVDATTATEEGFSGQPLLVSAETDLKALIESSSEEPNVEAVDLVNLTGPRPEESVEETTSPALNEHSVEETITVLDYSKTSDEPSSDTTIPKSPVLSETLNAPEMDRHVVSQISQRSSEVDSLFDHDPHRSSSPASSPGSSINVASAQKLTSISMRGLPTRELGLDASSTSELSEMDPNEEFDDTNNHIVNKPTQLAPPSVSSTDPAPLGRYPGDYVHNPALLGEPYSRWVTCGTCDASWVQTDAYFTRKECPRCERHSKLYGYQWPKTERAKGDTEDRVMDHRTVHRFLTSEEEAVARKRARGEEVDIEIEEEVVHGRRKSGRWNY